MAKPKQQPLHQKKPGIGYAGRPKRAIKNAQHANSNVSVGAGPQRPTAYNWTHLPGKAIALFEQERHEADPTRWPAPAVPFDQRLQVGQHTAIGERRPGSPPSLIQAACRAAFDERLPMLCRIADGDEVRLYEAVTDAGTVIPLVVQPSIVERLKALELMARVGRLYDVLPAEDGTPDDTERLDLSKLDDKELHLLERLLKLARATPIEAEDITPKKKGA
jgi:hypothetical protein